MPRIGSIRRMRVVLTVLIACALAPATAHARLELGLGNSPGGAAAMRHAAPFGYRYQYLAGGVNTGRGWATWNPRGTFVTRYIDESVKAHITPVFTYYQITGSLPGTAEDGDRRAIVTNLANPSTMKAYWADLSLCSGGLTRRTGGSSSTSSRTCGATWRRTTRAWRAPSHSTWCVFEIAWRPTLSSATT